MLTTVLTVLAVVTVVDVAFGKLHFIKIQGFVFLGSEIVRYGKEKVIEIDNFRW